MSPNHLINEKSPYLLQHAHNPVNWYPWSDQAFAEAGDQDKPIFLSVGYSACHWCHVMEKESFEDEETARYLNSTFICIKVDREERPDIDTVYMMACQLLNGTGGWPLTILMTDDRKPFFAATYLPKRTRGGRLGLIELCHRVGEIWRSDRKKVLEGASSLAQSLSQSFRFSSAGALGESVSDKAYTQIEQNFDSRFGGFGSAPKFPTPHRMLFLLRYYHRTKNPKALEMAEKTLTAMRLGGIWDHIGFGFHRYSTDTQWLLPHFEKMLYDQALLAMAYLEIFQITKSPFYAKTAEEICAYILREMTSPEGVFFSAQDADSQGEEGKFYVWTTDEFVQILGESEARIWGKAFNLKPEGNFTEEATGYRTGANVLYMTIPPGQKAETMNIEAAARWEKARGKLFCSREERIRPLRDDKSLTDWNGLMIAALAMGARILGRPEYAEAARKAARFILTEMREPGGRLLRRFREKDAGIPAQATDYAFFILGLIELYETVFDPDYLEQALILQDQMFSDFWDRNGHGFFLTPEGEQELPVRPKELYDSAIPSANSVSLANLFRLSRLTGAVKWEEKASEIIQAFSGTVTPYPSEFTYFLLGTEFGMSRTREVVIVGEPDTDETKAMIAVLNRNFAPNQVVLLKSEEHAETLKKLAGFTADMNKVAGKPTAYVCENFSCKRPTSDPHILAEMIQDPPNYRFKNSL